MLRRSTGSGLFIPIFFQIFFKTPNEAPRVTIILLCCDRALDWMAAEFYLIMMKLLLAITAAAAVLVLPARAADSSGDCDCDCGPLEDRVTHLPGLPEQAPNTRWYSGYLDYELAGQQLVHTHYTFIGAESVTDDEEDDTEEKPLIYWSSTYTDATCWNACMNACMHASLALSCSLLACFLDSIAC